MCGSNSFETRAERHMRRMQKARNLNASLNALTTGELRRESPLHATTLRKYTVSSNS